eukprot:TRINITY_DN60279_c0_g1_i1.p1 TRINITY_DN60279_c0_g1~~TRINITY_DN60279_c0_g1_i1.p1  ORF type:complete len:254 (+),score=30.50 TRINITY_DN60279_c0_g1_i1:48-764(+)
MSVLLRNKRTLSRMLCLSSKLTTTAATVGQIQPATIYGVQGFNQGGSVRYFADQPRSLVDVLKEELDHEKQTYEKPENLTGGPPAPFILKEQELDTLLTLTRTYNNEEIEINIKVNDQPQPEHVEDEEGNTNMQVNVIFTVSVTKGDQSLILDIQITEDQFLVDHVSLEPKDGFPSDSYYHGPVFDELDEGLVTGFYDFLEERGVNTDLANYLVSLINDKEQREYQSWLARVKDFLSK